jgi:hypothetical protein
LEALHDRIARGDDVDGRDGWGYTPLMHACESGHLNCAQALIGAGAAVDMVNNNGWTALMKACLSRHHECAQALIDEGAAVDEVDNAGRTALMFACASGRHECAQALIDAGAAVDRVDNAGRTALMFACSRGNHECARALIDAQADLELTNRDGQNALMIACASSPLSNDSQSQRQGRAECVLALLESMEPIREDVVADQAASLKCACERHRVLQVVLSASHIIECVPATLERASVLVSDVHSIIAIFARDMLASANPRRRSRRLEELSEVE